MLKQIRQGDILLEAVNESPPQDAKQTKEVILAEGELTGHKHRLCAPAVLEWAVNGQRYTRVVEGTGTISHEEHDPTPARVIEPGQTYKVIPQKEWDLSAQWRKVVD